MPSLPLSRSFRYSYDPPVVNLPQDPKPRAIAFQLDFRGEARLRKFFDSHADAFGGGIMVNITGGHFFA
jgi:hypothetical protein